MRCRSGFFLPSFCSLSKHKVRSRVCVPCSNLSKEERTKIAFLRPSLEPKIAGFLRERLQIFFWLFAWGNNSVFLSSSDFCQEKKPVLFGKSGVVPFPFFPDGCRSGKSVFWDSSSFPVYHQTFESRLLKVPSAYVPTGERGDPRPTPAAVGLKHFWSRICQGNCWVSRKVLIFFLHNQVYFHE